MSKVEQRLDLITMARNVAAARDLLKSQKRNLAAQCADTVLEELRAIYAQIQSTNDDRDRSKRDRNG